jgi:hypothetical protein
MAKVVSYNDLKLRRFSKEMRKIVDEIVKIERKWTIGATTVESAREDLQRLEEWIEILTDKAKELKILDELVKFRLDNSKAKIKKALRGEWGE